MYTNSASTSGKCALVCLLSFRRRPVATIWEFVHLDSIFVHLSTPQDLAKVLSFWRRQTAKHCSKTFHLPEYCILPRCSAGRCIFLGYLSKQGIRNAHADDQRIRERFFPCFRTYDEQALKMDI